MSENSKIEWTDHTFNPWIGCTKVSPGCANCYAERDDKRRKWTPNGWGKGRPRKRTKTWGDPVRWNREWAEANTTIITSDRPRVFCASLADWLDDEVPVEWLADLLALIHATPNLDWLLLTKRPENWRKRLKSLLEFQSATGSLNHDEAFFCWLENWLWQDGLAEPPANVWIGTSVEDQTRADERIPALLSIPARVRFLSCEPLLGPVMIRAAGLLGWEDEPKLDWVIAGGESGPNARPMHPAWARGLRDQCAAANVPFFFKQWGLIREMGCGLPGSVFYDAGLRVGAKNGGRLLDDREHSAFPA